jgi:hypothetical protein
LLALGMTLCAATWRKWPSPLIDFGRELYVPWQLTRGRALYGDIAYLNGPLSPHFNALVMQLFGTSWTAVIAADAGVLALITALIYLLLRRIAGAAPAVTACSVMLCAYGFSQYGPIGNNSLIAPFSHECTHGLLAAFMALWGVMRWIGSGQRRGLAVAGLGIGLTLLGKTEIAIATLLSCFAGIGAQMLVARRGVRNGIADAGLVGLGVLAPVALLLPLVGVGGVLTPWRALVGTHLLDVGYYRSMMGIDRPGENIAATIRCAVIVGAVVALAVIAGRLVPRKPLGPAAWAALALALSLAAACALVGRATMLCQVRMLPVAVLAILIWSVRRLVASRGDAAAAGRWIVTGALAMFSLAMLLRMALNVVVYPYGFELAMPATVVTVAFLTGVLPGYASRHEHGARVTAGILAGVCLAFALACVQLSAAIMSRKTEQVGRGGDVVVCTPRDAQMSEALLALVQREVRPDESLLVVPEGVIINYWTRRTNPTPHYNFTPVEIAVAGAEDRIVADLQGTAPDVIVGIPSSTARAYGFERFGVPGFGDHIMAWSAGHYAETGATPEADAAARLGIGFLRRSSSR